MVQVKKSSRATIFSAKVIPFINFLRWNEFLAVLNILKQMKFKTSDLPFHDKKRWA